MPDCHESAEHTQIILLLGLLIFVLVLKKTLVALLLDLLDVALVVQRCYRPLRELLFCSFLLLRLRTGASRKEHLSGGRLEELERLASGELACDRL